LRRVSGDPSLGSNSRLERSIVMPSTVIRRFEYDPRTRSLDVEFVSGRRYRYAGVPEEVAAAFREAFSKGRYFNARIRDGYPCQELTPEPAEDLWEL
jgi:KTSC domain-containing protein